MRSISAISRRLSIRVHQPDSQTAPLRPRKCPSTSRMETVSKVRVVLILRFIDLFLCSFVRAFKSWIVWPMYTQSLRTCSNGGVNFHWYILAWYTPFEEGKSAEISSTVRLRLKLGNKLSIFACSIFLLVIYLTNHTRTNWFGKKELVADFLICESK